MHLFNVHYSDDFDQKLYVEEVIKKWNKGAQKFHIYTSGTTIKPKKITSSKGFFTGFRNLTIDNAPIIPNDKAIFPAIRAANIDPVNILKNE